MAGNPQGKCDRRIIYCLLCKKPQDALSAHLTRVCMKKNTGEERQAELQKAKDSMKDWTRHGRTWDYKVLCRLISHKPSRLAVLEELQRKNFLIINAPMDIDEEATDEQPTTSSAAHQAPIVTSTSTEINSSEEANSSGSNDDAGDPMWRKDATQDKPSLRIRMQQAGLYEKFPRGAALLKGFAKYLTDFLQVPNCKQEVENVSRMLRYIQPSGDEISVDFLQKSTETQDFLNRLKRVQMGPGTILNYIKNMSRFVQYLKTRLDLAAEDADHHRKCQAYIELLTIMRKPVAKSLSSSLDESGGDASRRGQKRDRGTAEMEGKDFAAFLQQFPVTVSGQPPTKKQRVNAGFPSDRPFYDKWRIMQFGQREQYLLSQTSRCPPSVRRLAKIIRDVGWPNNRPSPQDVVKKWRPASKSQVESDPGIMRRVSKQKWSGLAIKDFGGEKGQGVVATREFPMGSIICDYHGEEITGAEGRRMMESMQNEMGSLFFFKAAEQDICIDAQTFPCECHPTLDTIGRRIKPSKKNLCVNVKPLHCRMKFEDSERNVILFKAVRDIAIDEEIRFQYGVKRKSFRGEGQALAWPDD